MHRPTRSGFKDSFQRCTTLYMNRKACRPLRLSDETNRCPAKWLQFVFCLDNVPGVFVVRRYCYVTQDCFFALVFSFVSYVCACCSCFCSRDLLCLLRRRRRFFPQASPDRPTLIFGSTVGVVVGSVGLWDARPGCIPEGALRGDMLRMEGEAEDEAAVKRVRFKAR